MSRNALRIALALLAFALPARAALDFDGTNDYASVSSAVVTDYPHTISCMVNADNVGAGAMFSVGDPTPVTGTSRTQIAFGATNKIFASAVNTAGTVGNANSSTATATGTWYVATGVETSATSRAAFTDGGGKGTNTTSITLTLLAQTQIGARIASGTNGAFLDGRVAECGIWNVALTDAEAASLGKFYSPKCVRPSGLAARYRLLGSETTTIANLRNAATSLTTSGGPTAAAHPRQIPCE